jgi:hypothetical protein
MNLWDNFLVRRRCWEGQKLLELGEIDKVFTGSNFVVGFGSLVGDGNSGSFTGQTVSKIQNFG